MNARNTTRNRGRETGIALLISIFILLLISVVAIALIVASGTESSLAGNYRSATGVYYAALAGLEEARGRLLPKNANSFKNTAPGFLPSPGTPLAIGYVGYVLNPGPTETMASILATYPDNEYATEFGAPPSPSNVQTTASIWNSTPLNALNVPGPLYKWVRINAVSEQSLKLDTYPYDGSQNPTVVYYDGTHMNDTNSGSQVLEITALAVLPNGSQKILQYLVAPVPINLPNFPAALTLAGSSTNGVAFTPPTSTSSFYASGIDLTTIPFCTAGPAVDAVGVFNNTDVTNVKTGGNGGTGIPAAFRPEYTGLSSAPDVVNVINSGLFPANLQTPSQLDALSQNIIKNADVIITPPGGSSALGSNLTPLGMTSSNPMTVVVNGDLDLNSWYNTGYGLLLVTGNLNYDPDASWQGIVLVIGKGTVTGSRSGSGEIDGAFFVAQTHDPSTGFTTVLPDPNLGKASVIFDDEMGGRGFRYSSCWIKNSIPSSSYKILSFHEISQ